MSSVCRQDMETLNAIPKVVWGWPRLPETCQICFFKHTTLPFRHSWVFLALFFLLSSEPELQTSAARWMILEATGRCTGTCEDQGLLKLI